MYHWERLARRLDDGGGTWMREMAPNVLAYIMESVAGMKSPTIKAPAEIGASDKIALTRRTDRRFLDVDQMRNAKSKKMLKMKSAPNNLLKTKPKKSDENAYPNECIKTNDLT